MRRVLAALAGVALVLFAVAPATAASSSDKKKRQQQIGQQIQSLQSQVDEASNEESALLGQIDTSRAKLADLTDRVQTLDAQLRVSERDLDSAERRLAQQDTALEAATTHYEAVVADLGRARQELKRRAVDAYVGQDQDVVSNVLLDLRSQRDVVAVDGYTNVLIDLQEGTVDRYDQLRESADAAAQLVAAARNEAHRQRDEVAARTHVVQVQRDQQDAVRSQAAAENAHESQLLDEVQSRKAEFEAQIASLQAESDQISAFLRTLSSSNGIVISGHGILSIPIPGAPITSGFGPRFHPIFHTVRMHTGIDFGAGYGTPIRAAADGTVVRAGWLGGYGNATVIDHGKGLATLYGHQSKILVSEGQEVKRGQVIGQVGATGFATGPHLHFEVRIDGTPVDPRPYL